MVSVLSYLFCRCLLSSGVWLDMAGEVDGTSATSEACVFLSNMTCRVENDTVVFITV